MRKFFLLALFLVLIPVVAAAGNVGCCCEPVSTQAQADGYLPQDQCTDPFTTFIEPTAQDLADNKQCNALCGELIPQPPQPTPRPAQEVCGAPNFYPEPTNVIASPVPGKNMMKLEWTNVCPADTFKILRCQGTSCTPVLLDIIGAAQLYEDASPNLLFSTPYTYQIIASYGLNKDAPPATVVGNLNDIECWKQTPTTTFCGSEFYYQKYESYLKQNGYPGFSANDFTSDFSNTIKNAFFNKFNRPGSCNPQNQLAQKNACSDNKQCIPANGGECVDVTSCTQQNLFGIGATKQQCEGTTSKNYCFYDKSSSFVNTCYACSPQINCIDYKSEDACQTDNCGITNCEWKDTFPALGAGVCVNTELNNCQWCDQPGTPGIATNAAHNSVFDACTTEKAAALSTTEFTCFADPNANTALSCDEITCADYSSFDCAAPLTGIKLDTTNAVVQGSSDPCGIGVCQYNTIIGCRKNADATLASENWPDCAQGDAACEQDYFPPLTTLIPLGQEGRYDFLNIRIFDKTNKSHNGYVVGGELGITQAVNTGEYVTHVCVGDTCAAPYTTNVHTTQLNLNDLNLQDGTVVIATLVSGQNTIKYYTVDPARNVEVVKSLTVTACTACSGPLLLSLDVPGARKVGDTFYTTLVSPQVQVKLNEPAELTLSQFTNDNVVIALPSPSSLSSSYLFSPESPLHEETYLFQMNAKDTNDILMATPVDQLIVVDNTPPTVMVTPEGESIEQQSIDMTLAFSELVFLKDIQFGEEVLFDDNNLAMAYTNITSLLTTTDNKTFTLARAVPLDGKKVIRIVVEDYAGNSLERTAEFVVNAGPPVIGLKSPSFGHSSTFMFDVVAVTPDAPATCKYWDGQTPPPTTLGSLAFNKLFDFDISGDKEHTLKGFNKITQANTLFDFFVSCKDQQGRIAEQTFKLVVDQSPPQIISAFANPDPIVQTPLTTTLSVATDDLTRCKYSAVTTNFNDMANMFPSFNQRGLTAHHVNITVPGPDRYTYHVSCINLADLGPVTKSIPFSVDLGKELVVKSTTQPFHNALTVHVGVETNKDASCSYKINGVFIPFELDDNQQKAHIVDVAVDSSGSYSLPVTCSTIGGVSQLGSEQKKINVDFTVDTTPPFMLFVNDSSNLVNDTEFSFFTDRIMVSFLGKDNETKVTRYYYELAEQIGNKVVINFTPSTVTDGKPFFIKRDNKGRTLNLTDSLTYFFKVKPENIVGLLGNTLQSDGVTIDITKEPAECSNGVLDAGETDVDCGGSCQLCADGLKCLVGLDCSSGTCDESTKTCAPSRCDDVQLNGEETDVDCGGLICGSCENDQSCIVSTDCTSGYCGNGVCAEPTACTDGVLTGLESDIDCGGTCPDRCTEGKACISQEDCAVGLSCVDGACQSCALGDTDCDGVVDDTDVDGIKDEIDSCPGTPRGERVDERGCSVSQRDSDGDGMSDGCELRYGFDPSDASDGAGDKDKDGLTNVQECAQFFTNPTEADTDGDRVKDKKEINAGTDPLDPLSFPKSSFGSVLVLILLIIVIGVAGYFAYPKLKVYLRKHPLPQFKTPKSMVRKQVYKKPLRKPMKDWLSLDELSEHLGKKDVSKPLFDKLKKFRQGKLPKQEQQKLVRKISHQGSALERLKDIAVSGMSSHQKKDIRSKLLKGKLSHSEKQDIFKKLKITSEYYDKNKKKVLSKLK